ncbi:MAG: hypothetical protein QM765_46215 [Myxococcales bacterium]
MRRFTALVVGCTAVLCACPSQKPATTTTQRFSGLISVEAR